ncbi:MAG: ppdK [Thermoleophilia bacterium]|nr:ppdK [Thermoleophilia bacterium]
MVSEKYVFTFGDGRNEGRAGLTSLLGGKGAHLAEMSSIGIPVPPGFTLTTEVCADFNASGGTFTPAVHAQVDAALEQVGAGLGRRFGDAVAPLLVSVRSGAPVSMPGMMDTVLNLGLNDTTVEALATASGDPRFAWDSYRRFIQMYASVVMGVSGELFEHALEGARTLAGVDHDNQLDVDQLRAIVAVFHKVVREETGADVPQAPQEQLWGAIAAVFNSWTSERAVVYRRHQEIPDSLGTAVTVQAMVFGNAGDDCATGVAFTRDPATGNRQIYGEYLRNAQGEDVVAGIRTPHPISVAGAQVGATDPALTLERSMPDAYAELLHTATVLERHYADAQDLEFTVQHGRLWLLQTRAAKRTAAAALQIAVDMTDEGMISSSDALLRVDASSLDQLLHPSFDPDAAVTVLGTGLPASPGAASGRIALDAPTAVRMAAEAEEGEHVLLVRHETSPEDIEGMIAARGILTARGGMTSHAAVVARGMGTTCVAGLGALQIDYERREVQLGGRTLHEGDWLSIDGATGRVLEGKVPTVPPRMIDAWERFMGWADDRRELEVWANADSPKDAAQARELGAQGIGLCRTEHMFFEEERITLFRRMILSRTDEARSTALDALLPMQRSDFHDIFAAMSGLPVTIRLLDPPLHEFLPHTEEGIAELAEAFGQTFAQVSSAVEDLRETNPMLGHRGCRLGITYPGIYGMQARAIVEAAIDARAAGIDARPEIMIPLVGTGRELELLANHVRAVAAVVAQERGQDPDLLGIRVGTMIEVPRACTCADEIAPFADFFSFGTNDLTQLTYGYSRDDAGVFLSAYTQRGVLTHDPFQSIDERGVGALMRIAKERGRSVKPGLKLGICGEHGGDPASVAFCHDLGLDYVSCSPFRVPIARLAAAQAAIRAEHARHAGAATRRSMPGQAGPDRPLEPLLG